MSYNSSYPKSHWNVDILEYLQLDTTSVYYKSYLLKCLTSKLSYAYGRYEIDDDLMNVFKNNNYNIWWKYMSKSGLDHAIRTFRNENCSKSVYKMNFNENGNLVEGLQL